MKIEITLNQETITENGRIVPAGTYRGEYNPATGMIKVFDDDVNVQRAIEINERLLDRAIENAFETCGSLTGKNGVGECKGRTCSVKLIKSK